MAEEQKTVEVPKAEEPIAPAIATEPAAEEKAVADKPEEATATEDKPTEEAKPEEATVEEQKEEVKPIEEGHLGHKAQGASFPKNFIPSKEFFFFGSESYEPKALSSYLKNEKSTATYHANVAWASETGKGLLFTGDKKAPTGIINLSDATEPETDGPNKFTLTSKGNKHSFKAANTAERDNWVAQLKLKIAEAKELSAAVVETENYKKTLESFAPAKKEEKTAAAATESKEEAKTEEPTKTEEATEAEAAKEEPKAEKADKAESPKPLKSKRASFFGFFDKKEETKAEEKKEEPQADAAEDKTTEEAADAAKPAEEATAAEETTKAEGEEAKTEEKPTEEAKPAESPKEKVTKRNSFFNAILSKKEKKAATEAKSPDTTEAPQEGEAAKTDENAPVIPPVEATTPLADAVNNDSNAPATVEPVEPAAAAETKKDTKEKRKSSIPFLGKREKSPAPVEGEEKEKSSQSAFSKLRATIKGRSAPKAGDKTTEEATKDEAKTDGEAAEAKEETTEPVKPVEPVADEVVKTEPETKPENVAVAAPAVTAAA